MDPVDDLKPEAVRLFEAKAARRRKLARLSFAQKVRAVVRLQEMAAPLLRGRGKQVRVWQSDDLKGE
ncbi:MAG: hypothetical protein HYS05_02755 [Acidobacteria bacterium]|nr:hypothetical protein [Acidobacteriota bacterium]